MPLELLAGGLLGKAADVYAFGVLLWQMWTGSRPWAGLRHHQVYEVGGWGEGGALHAPVAPAGSAGRRAALGSVQHVQGLARLVPCPGCWPSCWPGPLLQWQGPG
jgi:hypothetical protein